jgi:predicted enzyme related to lactoylglutathione lyase
MSQITTHAPGTFCWAELGTTDVEVAKRFYAGLFGWEPISTPAGEAGIYTLLKLRGREVGGLYTLAKEQLAQGVPPNWLPYVAVASADDATKKATALGATSLMGPFDVMEHGRMTVLQDPTGATFAVWQAKNHPGAGVRDEPGSMSWCELLTRDAQAAGKFYSALFGWTLEEMAMPGMAYTVFSSGSTKVGGMMTILKEWGPMPSNWLTYFAVDDCHARVDRARRSGAEITKPATEVPNIGYFAILRDPQGASFAIIQNAGA